jgi:glycosyltransferase involved in cell wall biosynthesis
MRVLYLNADPGVPVLGHKGASVHVRELTRALSRAGAEVVVAAPRVEPEGDVLDAPATLAAISPVLPKKLAQPADVRAAMGTQAAEVLVLAREHAIDGIYERLSLFSDAGVRAAARLGVPHVLEVNAPLREEAARFRTLPHPELAAEVERAVITATSRVLVVSLPLAARVVATGAQPGAVDVVPNGVAADVPVAAPGSDPETFTVGFAGSLKPWHGVELLLEAAQRAAARSPALRFEVVGEGPLAHLLAESPLPAERLHHSGVVPHRETLARIATWDAGVAPYLPLDDFYFSPLKVLEYMAAGVCPVVSALGDLPALLGHGARGVLVPAGDPDALAISLVELADNPARARALGEAAREHVLAERNWDTNAYKVLEALAAPARAVVVRA